MCRLLSANIQFTQWQFELNKNKSKDILGKQSVFLFGGGKGRAFDPIKMKREAGAGRPEGASLLAHQVIIRVNNMEQPG